MHNEDLQQGRVRCESKDPRSRWVIVDDAAFEVPPILEKLAGEAAKQSVPGSEPARSDGSGSSGGSGSDGANSVSKDTDIDTGTGTNNGNDRSNKHPTDERAARTP